MDLLRLWMESGEVETARGRKGEMCMWRRTEGGGGVGGAVAVSAGWLRCELYMYMLRARLGGAVGVWSWHACVVRGGASVSVSLCMRLSGARAIWSLHVTTT